MPFGKYKNFADCVSKNQSKDTPDAYCGYIKNQVEGGKKKEEALGSPEHEAFHLEEDLKKMEEEEKFKSATSVMNLALHKEDEDEVKRLEEEIAKTEEEIHRQSRPSAGQQHLRQRTGDEWTPESEITVEKAKAEFLKTLTATVDEVTLMAKDQGWPSNSGVSDKVAPTEPTYKLEVSGENVEVAVKQAKGFPVQINWFNSVLAELKTIVADANDFFEDAGWNSKEVVKEYNEHKSKWGKDYTSGT